MKGEYKYYDDARNEFIVEKTIEILDKTVWLVGKQLEVGAFVPSEFERKFETKTFSLEEGAMLRLTGVIDRIDTYEDNDNIYDFSAFDGGNGGGHGGHARPCYRRRAERTRCAGWLLPALRRVYPGG